MWKNQVYMVNFYQDVGPTEKVSLSHLPGGCIKFCDSCKSYYFKMEFKFSCLLHEFLWRTVLIVLAFARTSFQCLPLWLCFIYPVTLKWSGKLWIPLSEWFEVFQESFSFFSFFLNDVLRFLNELCVHDREGSYTPIYPHHLVIPLGLCTDTTV